MIALLMFVGSMAQDPAALPARIDLSDARHHVHVAGRPSLPMRPSTPTAGGLWNGNVDDASLSAPAARSRAPFPAPTL